LNDEFAMTDFQHSYAALPEHFHAPAVPAGFAKPELIAWNAPLAAQLGLGGLGDDPQQLAAWFSGSEALPGSKPIAQAYAGHQFGQFVPQLGDGRAALLGEVVDADGRRWDVQLKGGGRTPFSRGGDGKSSLGPVIREYVLSEAMYALGVPTTRALAAVATGEKVIRNHLEPGEVFTRVAASHVRIGTFAYFAARSDKQAVQTLAEYVIQRHCPEAAQAPKPLLALFRAVIERQAALVAQWMSFGFIHGVMNTDNTSLSGETIDYGPCAFMDEYRVGKVFSSIDRGGRYAYGNQPAILHWNMARLAETLLLVDEDLPAYQEALDSVPERFRTHFEPRMRHKLGLNEVHDGDQALLEGFLQHLEAKELDFTLSFRALGERLNAQDTQQFGDWETQWRERIGREYGSDPQALKAARTLMDSVNPLYIPRNHQVERAIQEAFSGDYTVFHELNEVLAKPFEAQPGREDYALAPVPEERVTQTFCGT
jgi:uncharacterized protein YdiU (UPF0061 family)